MGKNIKTGTGRFGTNPVGTHWKKVTMVNVNIRVIMVKLFGQTGKNNFSQNGQIGKKIFCGLNGKRALESRHIGNSEL